MGSPSGGRWKWQDCPEDTMDKGAGVCEGGMAVKERMVGSLLKDVLSYSYLSTCWKELTF